jgi:hypothetical protein
MKFIGKVIVLHVIAELPASAAERLLALRDNEVRREI